MEIQLSWTDPVTNQPQQRQLEIPIALGRDLAAIPQEINGNRLSPIILDDGLVSPYHALITENNGEIIVVDQNSSTGIKINDVSLSSSTLVNGDRLCIGPYLIEIRIGAGLNQNSAGGCDRMVGFLFKRRCGRTDPTGCPDCQSGKVTQNPYFDEYSYYPHYGSYDYWGRDYYHRRDDYSYDPDTGNVDFTEADAAALDNEMDADFEQDMGAS